MASYIGAGLLGGLMTFGFAPYGFWWLTLFVLGGFYGLLRSAFPADGVLGAAGVRPLWIAWWFGFGYFSHGLWWLYVSMHTYGGLPVFPAVALLALAAALLAFFIVLVVGLFVFLQRRFELRSGHMVATLFAVCWTLSELLRESLLTGFPWLSMGYSVIDTVWAGYAPVLGVFGVSFFYILSVSLLAEFVSGICKPIITSQSRAQWRGIVRSNVATPGVLLLVVVGGYGLNQILWTEAAGPEKKLAVLQGNIDQATKWTRQGYRNARDIYIRQTFSQQDADIIVWPETAVPGFWQRFIEENQGVLLPVLAQRKQVALIGTPVEESARGVYYNAMQVLADGADHGQVYFKQHLVPFGEYVPFAAVLVPWFRDLQIPYSRFQAGDSGQPLLRAGGLKILPSICYEIIFGAEIAKRLGEATVIVNISNDAWFGRSPASHQHLEMARMRAIELGRPLVRATNTGVSAVIDARGGVIWRSSLFEQVAQTVPLQPSKGDTPYRVWRDGLILGGLAGFMILMLFFNSKTNKNNG